MPLDLFKHNAKAYLLAAAMMNAQGKAAVVHPTGTGKSFIAFKLIEDNPDKVIFMLSPSEYIFETQCESVRRTAPEINLQNVHFFTYAKLTHLSNGELKALAAMKPSYIICDEFHRAGAECWGEATLKLLSVCPNAKLLGLTATNVRYLDNQRDMAQELFDGHIASEMTLGEAIVRGILPTPKYVTTVYRYGQELAKYQSRIDAQRHDSLQGENQRYLDALRRALEKADGLDKVFARHMTDKSGKYIVFCSNYEHMKEMSDCAAEWFADVNHDMHIYKAYFADAATSRAFADFKADDSSALKLLFCIDMLNEGIHVKGVSGVILFRPTVSPIIYKQQLGRALTSGDSATPLILDVVNNFDALVSIAALREEMQAAVQRMYANGEGEQIVAESFEVVEQVHDCRVLFEKLQNSLSNTWEQYYAAASVYAAENGSLHVPKSYVTPAGLKLGCWILYMRLVRRGRAAGSLTLQQIERLDAIGMLWDNPREIAWEKSFAEAEKYYNEHGDLLVPTAYTSENGTKLGAWIAAQRTAYKDGRTQALLNDERIARLEKIGMVWSAVSEQWELNYAEAVRYYNTFGNLDVPVSFKTDSGFALGRWLHNLQTARKSKNSARLLSGEQIARLDAIGMCWNGKNDSRWDKMYACACAYYQNNGHLNVPLNYITLDGEKLGRWIARQRSCFKNPDAENAKLTPERIEKLDAVGMNWKSGTQGGRRIKTDSANSQFYTCV